MNYSPKKMQDLLITHDFGLKKNYGQNFIVDENIINSIIAKSNINKETLVIEVGPGAGSLTYKLSEVAKKVIAFEIDYKLEPILKETLGDCSNIDIIFEDFLKADINKVIAKEEYKNLYVVANLPYYITTPIIVKLIEDNISVDKMVIMVQKEVGDRLKARPNSRDYSSLSVFLNYYFDISKLMDISRNVFMPKPNVDSIVVLLEKKKEQLEVSNNELFFNIIRDSFKQKRKTIRNNLIKYDLNIIEKVLEKYGFTLQVRAEQLELEVFVDMANELAK